MQPVQPAVGVIGAGRWGRNLLRTFHQLGALAAVAEANLAAHPALASQYPGIPLYADYQALLQSPVDAVVVATPAASHAEVAKAALRAGKEVLVEKPLTLRASEAEELVALAQAEGRLLLVGHLLLFQPAIQWIRSFLDSGRLGRPLSLHQERLNLGTARSVENALWSLGVHDVAVQLYLLGGAPSAPRVTGQRILQPGIEDDVYLHLTFPDGAQGHLHTSWLWPEKRRRLVLIGTDGMLTFDELAQSVTLHRKRITPELAALDQGSEVLFQGGGEPLVLEAQHFLDCVRAKSRSPLIDGTHGLQVVQVLEDATEALLAPRPERGEEGVDARPATGSDPAVPEH